MIKGYEAFIMQSTYHKKIILSLKLYLTHIHPTLKKNIPYAVGLKLLCIFHAK